MSHRSLKLLVLGAHPDDAEYHAGGLAAIYRQLGHAVRMVSVTNGGAGHHERTTDELVALRRREAAASAAVIGAESVTWDNPDGALFPTLDVREQIIREIRSYAPDLVLTHRTNDYHPDHRAVGQLVQDASYMVTVPAVAPDVPALRTDPVVAWMPDLFTRPCPLSPHVVVNITDVFEQVTGMLAQHVSQVFEWLPYVEGNPEPVPTDAGQRREWLQNWVADHIAPRADRFREALVTAFGEQIGRRLEFVEVYEISEYAGRLTPALASELFPAPHAVYLGP